MSGGGCGVSGVRCVVKHGTGGRNYCIGNVNSGTVRARGTGCGPPWCRSGGSSGTGWNTSVGLAALESNGV